jgi:hypothetical protein
MDIAVDRGFGAVAQLQLTDHLFAEFGHERPPFGRPCHIAKSEQTREHLTAA